MEFREYLRIILAHKKMIILLCLTTVAVSVLLAVGQSPRYDSVTTVLVRSALNQPQVSLSGVSLGGDTQSIQMKGETFGKILGSRAIAEMIVQQLKLDQELSGPSGKRWDVMGAISIGYRQLVKLIKYGTMKKLDAHQQLVEKIQGSIKATLIPNTCVMEITVSYSDAQSAADIVNSAAQVFVDHMREMNSAEARAARQFIEDRVKVASADLLKTQEDLREFIIREGSVYPESKVVLVVQEVVKFESVLKNIGANIEEFTTHIAVLREKLSKYNKAISTSTAAVANPIVQDLKKRLVDLEMQKESLSVDNGNLSPKMIAMDREMEKVQSRLATEVQSLVQSDLVSVNPFYDQLTSELVSTEIALSVAMEKKKALIEILKTFPKELTLAAEKQIQWDTLVSAVKFGQTNLDSLKTQLESARISEAQKMSEISVIDQAVQPPFPSGLPKAAYPPLGLFVALAAGVGLAFFLEYVDDSIKSTETVEKELKLPVYAIIPEIAHKDKARQGKGRTTSDTQLIPSLLNECLLTHFEPQSPIAEAYRSLRTNIQFSGITDKTKVFLVTSSVSGEGKTTTCANLGITLAHLGNRTLLIDADMRNPRVDAVFGKAREPGLSNIIGGGLDRKEAIVPSGIDNLDILCSGPIPPNPSELLGTAQMHSLIDALKNDYSFILIDTPPVIPVTDAAVLSGQAHGVIFVIRSGTTSRRLCLRAKLMLEKVHANIIGAVVNGVPIASGYEHYYYYQGYRSKADKV
ncbi:MAG: polysaccharide biosynthesis tyrosine autokinase [bacterium]